MKSYILLALLTLLHFSSNANHFTGAQLRYEYTGSNQRYRIYLTLYKTCETSAIDLPTFINVYVESKSNSLIINKNLSRISNDTLQAYCTNTLTSCNNLSSPYPGYISATYTDTITIPVVANDWLIVFSNSNRNIGIANLQGASGQSFYVDAPLNMGNYINTSAAMPDAPPHVIFVNDSITIPLTAYDTDGDSVTFDFIQPISSPGVLIPYYSGYSITQPFGAGGLCYIDAENNMVMKSTNTGKYTIAMKIREYRNGTQIAYTLRDFIVICVSSPPGNMLSIPTPISTKNIVTYTCPGRKNTLTFNFADPVATDSVYLQVIPPTIPGWTFNTISSPNTGTGTASISWTTPPSLIPANLPFFNIQVKTYDNGCMLKGRATYVYTVKTRECTADSVWPGDANSDKIVDLYDPLAIALAYKDTGAVRPGATANWQAEACDFWDGSILNNIDKKHADCNGNGVVDTADINAITLNYGKIHAKGTPAQKGTADGELHFDHTGIHPNPDSTVTIKLMLGKTSNITDLYGLASNINIDGLNLSIPPAISYSTSWLGNNTNTLSFVQSLSNSNIDWAYSRTDKQTANGQGALGEITFKIPGGTPAGTLVTLSYSKYKLIDDEGNEKNNLTAKDDTFYVQYPASVNTLSAFRYISLSPNPSTGVTQLNLSSETNRDIVVLISGVTGATLLKKEMSVSAGHNHFALPTQSLVAGVYIVTVKSNDGLQVLKFIKQ